MLSLGGAACSRSGSSDRPLQDAHASPSPEGSGALDATATDTRPDAASELTPPPINPASSAAHADAAIPNRDAREAFFQAKGLSARLIGHTSVVLKWKLEGGLVAAWKPDSRRGRDRYRGEIAARRLGVALHLSNVPEACLRSFSKAELRQALDREGVALIESEVLADKNGDVPGALIPWIEGLGFPPLESEPLLGRWKAGLAGTATKTSDEDAALFADLSTLIAFDTISGNWDRWSGANVGKDPHTGRLLFIDNDGAFYASPPPDALARNQRLLGATKRFSKAFTTALEALDASDATRLERVFGEDLAGKPLLAPKAVEGVRARLALVRAAIQKAGSEGRAALP